MSTKLSKQPISERQELADQRRVAVFMFIATHPNPRDPDHCFTESISYIANCIRGGNRDNVKYALESLIASGDIIVVEKERRHDPQGKLLPNRLGTVPIRTFWLREWIRGGSRGQKPALESTNRALTTPSTASGTQATCALGNL